MPTHDDPYDEFPVGTRVRVVLGDSVDEGCHGDYYHGDEGVVVAPRADDSLMYEDTVRVNFDATEDYDARTSYLVATYELEAIPQTPEWGQEPGLVGD